MGRLLFFSCLSTALIFAQEQQTEEKPQQQQQQQNNQSCFPSCHEQEHQQLQCTGLFSPREGPQERWTEVAAWVKRKAPDAYIDERIMLKPGKYGDQVTATADMVKRGEILLRLPVSSFLLEEDCFPTEAFAALGTGYNSSLKKLPNHTWNTSKINGADFTQAGLCLLIHRILGKDSPYEGYIRHLPPQSSNETYMFQNFSVFDPIRGSDAYRVGAVVKKRHLASLERASGDAFTMVQDYFPSLNWTVEELRHNLQQTLSLCGSRTFNLDSDMLAPAGQHKKLYRPALVPLLDLLNHGDGRTRNCQYYFNTSQQYFQLQAVRDIAPGDELVHSYGPRSNSELLLFYGFMMANNTEDFVSVPDLTPGAIDFNYHTELLHDRRCHTPYFRAVEGSAWPPKFQAVIPNASVDANASLLHLGPLRASMFHSFQARLEKPLTENLTQTFAELSANSGQAVLRIVNGDFVLTNSDRSKFNETSERGNLTVELIWRGSPHHQDCESLTKPRCEDFLPGVSSVSIIVNHLRQGTLPLVARAGGCLIYSEKKKHTYEIKMGGEGQWVGVVTARELPPKGTAGDVSEDVPNQDEILRDFQFKRSLIRAAGLEEFATKVFRTGMLEETLAAVRIAVLPALSSLSIHNILSGRRFDPALEQQVAKTLAMFCFEELSRRLQVLGVDSHESSLLILLKQSRSLASESEARGNYEALARNELDIMTDFCTGIAEWGIDFWK